MTTATNVMGVDATKALSSGKNASRFALEFGL
jgi:hypothetical protein